MPIKLLFEPALIMMVQSTVMYVTNLSVSSNLPAKLGRKWQGGYCEAEQTLAGANSQNAVRSDRGWAKKWVEESGVS